MNVGGERRRLHFDTLHEALADAEALARGAVTTVGAYSFGQILEHLARTLDIVTGHRQAPKVAWPIRLVARMLRSRFLYRPMRAGFRLPSKAQSVFWPSDDVTTDEGLQHYREAIDRFDHTEPLPEHLVLGAMTRSEHIQLQCRHAELHLSFVHRADEGAEGGSGE